VFRPAGRHPSEDVVTSPNDCNFSGLLGPFHDGELPADQVDAITAHLATCQGCAGELADIRQFSRAFGSATRPPAPPPERWESAVLTAARDEGLLPADGLSTAVGRPAMRIAGGADYDADGMPAAGRPAAEPRHLWYVRRLSAAAAAVFVLAAGQMAYQRYLGGPNGTGPVPPTERTKYVVPQGTPAKDPAAGITTTSPARAVPGTRGE
jgi:hypothetical protein